MNFIVGLGEADTRAKLIDPANHARGWTEELIRREETAVAIEIIDGKPRKRANGRVEYTLRVVVNSETSPSPSSSSRRRRKVCRPVTG